MSTPSLDDQRDPFYVGYLPAPRKHRGAMMLVIVLVMVWVCFASLLFVLAQRSPGEAVWDISNERTWTGLLIEDPYPMLVTSHDTLLVVSMGKQGAHDQLASYFNSQVTISGYELQREGRRMIELSPGSIRPVLLEDQASIARPELEIIDESPHTFVGEIIDGKCYLGAMKPGDGYAHRSCAVLCLSGGLPPMFAPQHTRGTQVLPLILYDNAAHIPEDLHVFVACPVEFEARAARIGSVPVLVVETGSIRASEEIRARGRGLLIETAGG